MELFSVSDAGYYINEGLKAATETCVDENSIAIFKLILEKAFNDGHIDRLAFHKLDNRAEVKRMENAPFIKSMQESIRANTTSIKELETNIIAVIKNLNANIMAVNESHNALKQGMSSELRRKAALGFFCSVINVVTFGVGGPVFDMVMSTAVDFGDPAGLVKICGGKEQMVTHFRAGINMAATMATNHVSEIELKKALSGQHPMVALSTAVHLSSHVQGPLSFDKDMFVNAMLKEDEEKMPPNHAAAKYGDEKETAVHLSSGQVQGSSSFNKDMFANAMLEEHEEKVLPVHAAVKYGYKKELVKELRKNKEEIINALDSEGRTSMDLAAITGQNEFMDLIEINGGEFAFKSGGNMRAIAEQRAPHMQNYLKKVRSDL